MRGGGRAERDLQEAENEARGEINDLNTDLDRILNKVRAGLPGLETLHA